MEKTIAVLTAQIDTPLGLMQAGATARGICLLEFIDFNHTERAVRRLGHYLKGETGVGENDHLRQLRAELGEYFHEQRRAFEVPLDMQGTVFQLLAWNALLKIPYGESRTYQQVARQIGRPAAIRAVGTANGSNPIAIVVPCHRLVNHRGGLSGYGGGLWRKQYLRELEHC